MVHHIYAANLSLYHILKGIHWSQIWYPEDPAELLRGHLYDKDCCVEIFQKIQKSTQDLKLDIQAMVKVLLITFHHSDLLREVLDDG